MSLAEYTRELWEREPLMDVVLKIGVGKVVSNGILFHDVN